MWMEWFVVLNLCSSWENCWQHFLVVFWATCRIKMSIKENKQEYIKEKELCYLATYRGAQKLLHLLVLTLLPSTFLQSCTGYESVQKGSCNKVFPLKRQARACAIYNTANLNPGIHVCDRLWSWMWPTVLNSDLWTLLFSSIVADVSTTWVQVDGGRAGHTCRHQ